MMRSKQAIPYLAYLVFLLFIIFFVGSTILKAAEKEMVGFASVNPGAGIVYNEVLTVKERKFRHMVRQHTDFSCGAASLATILKYFYRFDVNEQQVLRGLMEVSDPSLVEKRGFSLLDMARYLEQFALSGNGFRVTEKQLLQLKIPAIVLISTNGYNHFVVLKRVTPKQIFLADPSIGNRAMPMGEFLSSWNGVLFAVLGEGSDDQSLLLVEQQDSKTSGLLKAIDHSSNSEMIDFGFIHSQLMNF